MPLHTKLIIICHKTGKEVIVHKDCFSCKDEQLKGVGMTHLNCKNYKITVNCNDQILTPKILVPCPLNNLDPKTEVYQNIDECYKCASFLFLTFFGQSIRLTCTHNLTGCLQGIGKTPQTAHS